MNTLSIKNLNELNQDFCTSFQLVGDQFVAVELSSGWLYVGLWYCEGGVFNENNIMLGKTAFSITSRNTITLELIESLVRGIQSDIIKTEDVKAFVNDNLSPSCYAYKYVMDSLLSDLSQAYDEDTIEDLQHEYSSLCNSGGTYWEDNM